MTWRELLISGTEQLSMREISEADTDAWILLEHVSGMDRAEYFCRMQEKVPEGKAQQYQALIDRRSRHIPVQQITGVQNFCGLEFQVSESVLIPRQDTECLVEEARKGLQDGARVLDVCTGSGCIIISLKKLAGCEIDCTATDISGEALEVAGANAKRLEASIRFLQGDLFESVTGEFDLIVSNPPYIASGAIETLMPEVREHEPRLALDGGSDGLDFYRRLTREAKEHLRPGGRLLFEIGYDQGESVSELMRRENYDRVEVYRDLAGLDRIVSGYR